MKTCECCGTQAPADQATCAACGEASWSAVVSPVVADKPKAAASAQKSKGKD